MTPQWIQGINKTQMVRLNPADGKADATISWFAENGPFYLWVRDLSPEGGPDDFCAPDGWMKRVGLIVTLDEAKEFAEKVLSGAEKWPYKTARAPR